MSIEFNDFDSSSRASIVAIELRGQKESVSGDNIPQIGLIVGQYDQDNISTITDYEPVQILTADEAAENFGFGSELHRQAIWIFGILGGYSDQVYMVPVPEPDSATSATQDVTFTTDATSSGTYYFSIGGDVVSFAVPSGSTVTEIAALMVAAITAKQNIAVDSTSSLGVVTITAKTAGLNGNEIRIVQNPSGDTQSSYAPDGTTVAVGGTDGYLESGAGSTDVHDVFMTSAEADNLGDRWYTQITCPYNDDTNLGYYDDSWNLRADATVRRRFDATVGYVTETYAEAYAIPATINSEGISPVWDPRSYSPHWELQAAIVGIKLAYAEIDPGRPFKTLSVGIPVDTSVKNLTYGEYDTLFTSGMGYCKIVADELVAGDMAISYRTNSSGADTEEWYDSVSQTRRQQFVYDVETLFSDSPYSRGMVADDDSISTKSYVIKPKQVIADMAALVDSWDENGWVKNATTIKESISAEISDSFDGRIDTEVTLDEAYALRIVGIVEKFLY